MESLWPDFEENIIEQNRSLQILKEQTLLDEGYMPLDPINDRGTEKIRREISEMLLI